MSELVLADSSESEVSEYEKSEEDEDDDSDDEEEEKEVVKNVKVAQADLTPAQRALVEKTHKLVADILGQHTNAAPVSIVLSALSAALDQAAPHLEHLAALKSHVDREVALRTQELAQVVSLLVSAEAAVQGLKSLKAFCLQRNTLTVKCEQLASFGHQHVTVPIDFEKLKEFNLLAYIGAKGVASAQLSSVSLWLLLCNEGKTRFLTVSGKLGCKLAYAQGQLLSVKKGPLHDVCKKVAAKQVQGYVEDGCLTNEIKLGLTDSLQVVRVFSDWKAFKVDVKATPLLQKDSSVFAFL